MESYGPLDIWLAKMRYHIAQKQIRRHHKGGRILDIGCGTNPIFLRSLDFEEKHGVDQNIREAIQTRLKETLNIAVANVVLEEVERFPYPDDFFDVVTMLAVFEHIEPDRLVPLHRDLHRILKPEGIFIMTTPAVWTDFILRSLAGLRLISDTISEHKDAYTHQRIVAILEEAGFAGEKMRYGHFECFMNLWLTARK